MAEKEDSKSKMEAELKAKTASASRKTKSHYRVMSHSYLNGTYYQRGTIVELRDDFAEKYPDSFQKIGINTPDTGKVYNPIDEAMRNELDEKYTKGLYTPPQASPVLGKMMES